MIDLAGQRFVQPIPNTMAVLISKQQVTCLADIREGIAHITSTEVAWAELERLEMWEAQGKIGA